MALGLNDVGQETHPVIQDLVACWGWRVENSCQKGPWTAAGCAVNEDRPVGHLGYLAK